MHKTVRLDFLSESMRFDRLISSWQLRYSLGIIAAHGTRQDLLAGDCTGYLDDPQPLTRPFAYRKNNSKEPRRRGFRVCALHEPEWRILY